ncbi:MAG: sigma-70 family RNA polymerase sigma factor [Phycisphaerales bacterium]|nr:sigma-70 family RNA polymerase sigma factor [Phycisphaerales bacterium]
MNDAPTPSDAELARLAAGGSLPAFGTLVERYEPRLRAFLARRVPGAHDLDDLVQEAFVRAWEHIDRYDDRWQFSTWLFTIGGRLAMTLGRRRTVERAYLARPAVRTDPDGPPDHVMADEARGRVWTVAERVLGDDALAAVWLRYGEDMAIADIARIMDRSLVSVRVLLFRSRERLARAMTEPNSAAARTAVADSVGGPC